MRKRELLYTVGWEINWCSHYQEQVKHGTIRSNSLATEVTAKEGEFCLLKKCLYSHDTATLLVNTRIWNASKYP